SFFFSSRRRHTSFSRDWSSDVCSSDLDVEDIAVGAESGFIAIPGEDIADATDAHDPPTEVTVTTGETALGQEGGYVVPRYAELKIGRASCRERVERSVGAVSVGLEWER